MVREGRLDATQRACLQARVADPSDKERRVASNLLLFDARHVDDDGELWRTLAIEHVGTFPADVVTLVHLANHYQRQGPDQASTSMAYAQRGLAYLQRHPPDTPSEKRAFHDLAKALAVAAEMLAPPEAPLETRDRTARYARDWYVAATALSLPTERAIAMCTNAGATEAFCTGEASQLRGPVDPKPEDTDPEEPAP